MGLVYWFSGVDLYGCVVGELVYVFVVWVVGMFFYLVLVDGVVQGGCVQVFLQFVVFDWIIVGGFLVFVDLVWYLLGQVLVYVLGVGEQYDVVRFGQCFEFGNGCYQFYLVVGGVCFIVVQFVFVCVVVQQCCLVVGVGIVKVGVVGVYFNCFYCSLDQVVIVLC